MAMVFLAIVAFIISATTYSPSILRRGSHIKLGSVRRGWAQRRVPSRPLCAVFSSPPKSNTPTSGNNGGLRILEWAGRGGLLPQPLLVQTAKTGWREAWKIMVSELAPQSKSGDYIRPTYGFQGKLGTSEHPAVPGRYQLYVGNACPWCHRVLLAKVFRNISMAQLPHTELVDDPTKASRGGWVFGTERDDQKDPLFGSYDLRALYERCSPGYTGRCTAPLLIDKETGTIVSNESEDLVRMLNEVDFEESTAGQEHRNDDSKNSFNVDLYPPHLQADIDAANRWIYSGINNGVYRCGFATSQSAYDRAMDDVTKSLDRVEGMLSKSRFLLGEKITESDLRLLPTVARFDSVYFPFFKCTNRRIENLPNLKGWLQDMYMIPGVKETLDLERAKSSYFTNLFPLNPSGIIPRSPSIEESMGLGRKDPNRGSLERSEIFFDKTQTRK